jgi:hypothetical protein
MIPVVGVEPTLQKEHDFESCASANSATPARYKFVFNAEDRNRTGTVVTYRRILSPVRLPVPPPRRNTLLKTKIVMEAATGFEPVDKGFADLGLTTWLCRHYLNIGAEDGIRTRDPHLGKVVFYH